MGNSAAVPTAEPDLLASALPTGARVLHIGLMKTGTTALQHAAAAHRADLARHGVCYPGRGTNHLYPVCALMGRRLGWSASGAVAPDLHWWRDLLAEIEAAGDQRVLVSHEFASECDDEQAARFVDELGPQLRVVITLRGFATLLGSSWQQYVKAGRRKAFHPWLKEVLAEQPRSNQARAFYRRHDQATILRRWLDLVGPDRLIMVLGDPENRTLLPDAFSDLLGLPREFLRDSGDDGQNRSLSWQEAEFLRRVNTRVHQARIGWRPYEVLIRDGLVARTLKARRPTDHETPMVLPAWAEEPALTRARRYHDAVVGSGCQIIGDPARLLDRPRVGELPTPTAVPLDAATEATAGLLSAALGQGSEFDVTDRPLPPQLQRLLRFRRGRQWVELNEANPTASAGDLFVVALLRAGRQLRQRLRRSS
ncbi:MAG TPA: hypothetical protein VEX66_13105 [Microlunatus sp.]|nr:hypothetical protein [Microlunatus sp.]